MGNPNLMYLHSGTQANEVAINQDTVDKPARGRKHSIESLLLVFK